MCKMDLRRPTNLCAAEFEVSMSHRKKLYLAIRFLRWGCSDLFKACDNIA